MEYLNAQNIAGFFFTVAGVILILHRVGIFKIPSFRNKNNPIKDEIIELREIQLLQKQIIEQHKKRFDKGDKKFERIEFIINEISINVGILLDRTK